MGLLDRLRGSQDLSVRAENERARSARRAQRSQERRQHSQEKWSKKGIERAAATLGARDLVFSNPYQATATLLVDGQQVGIDLDANTKIDSWSYEYRTTDVTISHDEKRLGFMTIETSNNFMSGTKINYSGVDKGYMLSNVTEQLRTALADEAKPAPAAPDLAGAPELSSLVTSAAATPDAPQQGLDHEI